MRSSVLQILYGEADQIRNLNILLVGVGGIGCEVLKCICKLPLRSVHILDMDTIELTNLNRQFLFRFEHRGHSKALTARDTVLKINPDLNITAHHQNIKQKDAQFFRQFNLVIMALDNTEARSFVNQVCVALGIPMVDAGTSGYNGQVQFIIPRVTPCFACETRENNQTVFQVCTIRTKPDKPIHCITWAKFLFEAMFSPQNQGNILNDISKLASQLKSDPSMSKVNDFICQIFNRQIKALLTGSSKVISEVSEQELSAPYVPVDIKTLKQSQLSAVQEYPFNINCFKQSLGRLLELTKDQPFLSFEKDDSTIMNFISSSANLRMHIFNIPSMTYHAIKQIAGNIIPAIASTNSIVSGVQITQALKYCSNKQNLLRYVFLLTDKRKLASSSLDKPNPQCVICSIKYQPVVIEKSFDTLTLKYLVQLVRKYKPDLDFSINIKQKTKDSRQLKQLVNTMDYDDGNYTEAFLTKSISHFDKEKRIIRVFVTNQDTNGLICYMYLMDAFGGQETVDLRGFQNDQVSLNPVKKIQEQTRFKMQVRNGRQGIILDDSEESDSDSLQIVEFKRGPQKRSLEESKLDVEQRLKRTKMN